MLKFIQRIWEAIKHMFGRDNLQKAAGNNITLSDEMITAIELWSDMLNGKAPWIDDDKGIVSMRLEESICKEFANIALSEMETNVKDPNLNEVYTKAISTINENLQDGLALGSLVIKPIGATGEIEFITEDRIIPIEFDANGKLRWCAFIESKPFGKTDVYYRVEIHHLTDSGLEIQNIAYKGSKNEIGTRTDLSVFEDWAKLPESVMYAGMDRMDFGYYRNPIPNRIDGSKNGISIYANAIEKIRKADIQAARLDWEVESGERMVFADYTTLYKEVTDEDGKKVSKFRLPAGKKRLFAGLDTDVSSPETFSPEIRDANFINVMNEYKRDIEFSCCLAYGDLSKNETVEKTATEIIASRKRKYYMVNAIQKNLKDCLEDLAYALAFYAAKYRTDLGFECNFHDSILTDEETERAQDRMDMAAGIMSPIEYRMKWYNEDAATAAAMLPVVKDTVV